MVIGILKVILHFPYIHTLKGKRQKLNSIKENLKQKYNISISEVDFNEYWQKSLVGISMINDDKIYIERKFTKILDYFNFIHEGYIIEHHAEYIYSKEFGLYEKV